MGVPAVFRAVSLISNTIGALSMEVYRNEIKLSSDETPRIVIRPNPFTTPRVFYRDSAYYLARYGEVWWWTAKRDADGTAMSVLPIDPRNIQVTPNQQNLLKPQIEWLDVTMPNDDMTQITLMPDPNDPLRGIGPLQMCGAAVSVAVEAQEWAANFFAGSPASTLIKSAVQVDSDEAAILKTAWMSGAGNLPKVIDPGIESVTDIGVDPQKAQLTDIRSFQNGEVALMFGIPGVLMEHAVAGSSLTYQNLSDVWDSFVRGSLWPNYLEGIEQAMTDLLTRSLVGRFDLDGLLRADIQTRFNVYNLGIPLGVLTPEEARAAEGLGPGNIENRPVPFASPAAIPSVLPIQGREEEREIRCSNCSKLLVEHATGSIRMTCPRCKNVTTSENPIQVREEPDQLMAAIAALAERPIQIQSPVTIEKGAIQLAIAAPQPVPEPNVIEVTREDGSKLRLVASNE